MSSGQLKLQVLLSALDRVSGPLKKMQGGSTAAARALKATQGELRRLNDAQQKLDQFRTLKLGAQASGAALAKAKDRLHALSAEMRGSETVSRRLGVQFRAAKREVVALTDTQGRQQSKLNALRMTLDRAGVSTTRLAQHERALRADIDRANAAMDAQKATLGKLHAAQQKLQRMRGTGLQFAAHGAGALAAGTVAARGIGAPVAAYAAQEDAATALRASMMGAGGKVGAEFARVDALAQRLGNRLPGTTAEFYDMLTMLQRQGMSAKVILGGLGEATAYLGVQLKMDTPAAAEFAAKLQDATRTSERDMMSLSDVIQRTFYLGVDPDNMLQGFSKLTSSMDVLRTHGIAAARMFAPLLVMADQTGMRGEASGNAYRKVFQGTMDVGKMAKANALLTGTGVNLDFTNGKGEFGGLDQMYRQFDKLKQLTTQDRLAVIRKMFGDDAETLQVVSLMISKGVGGYAQVQAKLAAQASLQQRVNSQLGTLRNLWEAASGTFVNFLAAMGEAVAPQMKSLVEGIGAVAQQCQLWAKANPQLAGGLLKVAAVLTGIVIAAGGLALALGTLLMPFAGLNMVMAGLGVSTGPLVGRLVGLATRALPAVAAAIRIVGSALIANPIGIVLMLIAGLAYLIWKRWDVFGPMFAALWKAIVAAASWAWEWLKRIFAWTPLGIIVSNWGRISSYMQTLWTAVKTYITGAWNVITGIFSGDGSKIRAGLAMMFNAINGVLGGWPAKFVQFGINLMQGLIRGIAGMTNAVRDAVVGSVTGAVDRFKQFLGIKSPSRLFAQFGAYTMQGYAGGLDRGRALPLRQIAMLGSRMQQAGAGLALAGAVAPAMAIDSRAPLSPTAGAGGGATYSYTIHIHAAPGASYDDLVKLLRAELDRIERARGARQRSALSDYGD